MGHALHVAEKSPSRSPGRSSSHGPMIMRQATLTSQDILQPKADRCACGGGCPHCREHLPILKELAISEPGDAYEQEADRVADEVLAAPAHPEVNGSPPHIQRFSGRATGVPGVVPASVDSALASPGNPLEPMLRQDMEQRFGHDFSQVRVHSGTVAEQSARDVSAHAYTVGHDVVFGAGRFAPGTNEGRRLIAHELTHVVQQSSGGIGIDQSRENRGLSSISRPTTSVRGGAIQREPVTAGAATVTIGAVVAKCIIGAIVGALFDAAIQAALYAWKERTWRFWGATLDYCSIILSAILGCIAAPISAFILEGWIVAQLGTLGGIVGTLIGKILIFIAKKLAIGIPKGLVGNLAKLRCISPEQAAELGVTPGSEAAP